MPNERVRAAFIAGVVVLAGIFQFLPDGGKPPKAHAASFQFTPTAGQLVTGTPQNATSQSNPNAEGVNVGSYKGTLADDNFHWTFASTASGYDANLTFGGAAANGANTIFVQAELDLDATIPQTLVQICDWSSSASVDNAADAACSGGGWRTLNNRKVPINTATATSYTWQIGDGYWSNGSNVSISTPISNFFNSSNEIKVRFYSTTNTTSTVAIDYVKVQAVINPVYTPGGFVNDGGGSVTGDYTNTTAIHQGASDNQYLEFAGTGGSAPAGYFVFKNIKPYTGMNTVVARYETSCSSAAGPRYNLKIRNFQTNSWEDLSGLINCSTTDSTNVTAKNSATLTDYISSGSEMWVRLEGDANSATGIRVDQFYIQLGSTSTDTAECQISIGSQTSGRIINNPSTGSDKISAVTIDSSYIYSAGYDTVPGNRQWRIEKRNKSDGALVGGFGVGGVVQQNPSSGDDEILSVEVDANYIYVAGYDNSSGNQQYRLEKRDILTGALVPGFSGGGVYTVNPTGGNEQAVDIAIDGGNIYLLGNLSTINVFRIQKHNINDGSLVSAFGGTGIVEATSGTNRLDPKAIRVDGAAVYVGGGESNSLGQISSQQYRIEKRDINDGTLVPAFNGTGILNINPTATSSDLFSDLDIDGSYLYSAGMQSDLSNPKYRIDKRDITTGAAVGAFGASGVALVDLVSSNGVERPTAIRVDGSSIYIAGQDASENPVYRWNISKLDITAGTLVTAFANIGSARSTYTDDDQPLGLAIDANHTYVGGYGAGNSDGAWMLEKRDISTGSLVAAGFGAEDCSASRSMDTTAGQTDLDRVLTENESNSFGHDYYAYDNDANGSTGEAAAVNYNFTVELPSSAQATGVLHAARVMGGIGDTVQLGVRDYSGRNNTTGGWTAIGETSTFNMTYTDNITGGVAASVGMQANAPAYINTVNNSMNLRLRTSAGGNVNNDSVHDVDFIMVSPQWVENPKTPTRTHAFTPTDGALINGTSQAVAAATGPNAEGVNVGSWKGALASDSYHWTFASTPAGMDAQLSFGGVTLNGANAMLVETRFDQDTTVPGARVQICDWVSSASVDNAADAQCTTGGWRTLNNLKNPTDATAPATYTWQVSDGYWNDGTNNAVSTPLGNFLDGSNTVKLRYFSTTNTTSTLAIDYATITPVVNSIYTAGGFTNLGSGSVTNTYRSTNGFVGAFTGGGITAQYPSDDNRLGWAGTAGTPADGYLTFKSIRTLPGMNTISFRAEHRCSAVGIDYRPKIYNFNSSSWEDLSTSSIACSTTDATNVFAKNSANLRNYINNGEARIGFYGLANGTQAIEVDMAYATVGMVNNDNTTCSISFGTQNAGSCDNTRDIDTTASANTWDILAEDTSNNQGHDFYPFDPQVTTGTNLEAKAAHVKFPVYDMINGSLVGYNWAGRYMSGAGGTVTMDIRDYAGKSNVEGGFRNIGSPVTNALIYVDSISIGAQNAYVPYLTNPEDHRDQLSGQSWFRLRTTANSSAATNAVGQWDFAMLAPMWIETSPYLPETDEQMRHGKYFRNGVEQPMVQ